MEATDQNEDNKLLSMMENLENNNLISINEEPKSNIKQRNEVIINRCYLFM